MRATILLAILATLVSTSSATPLTYSFPVTFIERSEAPYPYDMPTMGNAVLSMTTDGALGQLLPSDVLAWTALGFNSSYAGASITPDVFVFPNGTMTGQITESFLGTLPGSSVPNWSGQFVMRYEQAIGGVNINGSFSGSEIFNGNVFAPFVPSPEPSSVVLGLVGAGMIAVGLFVRKIQSGPAAGEG